MALRYVMLKNLTFGKWPEMTSLVKHSQCLPHGISYLWCLPINFNIFNGKKYCVA